MTALKAHFDGKHIILDEPAFLTPKTKVTVLVEEEKNENVQTGNEKPVDLLSIFGEPVDMGIDDLSINLDHYLYGLPKKL